MTLFILLGFFVVIAILMHFALLKPYKKKVNDHAVMVNSIMPGNVVYTEDGIRGKVDKVGNGAITLSTFPEGKRLAMELDEITQVENYDKKAAEFIMNEKVKKNKAEHEARKKAKEDREAEEMKLRREARRRARQEKKK